MRNWAKNTSRAAIVAASAVAVGASFASAGAVANADMKTSDNFGVLNGNQISIPINLAANVCGVSVGVLGKSGALAQCEAEIDEGKGGKGKDGYGHHGRNHYRSASDRGHGHGHGHGRKDDVDMKTSGNFGVLNGNQVYVPVNAAANVCGVSAAVVGKSQALAECEAEIKADRRKPDMKTSGNYGLLNGNQISIPVDAAANVCGVSAGVLGLSQAAGRCEAEIGEGDDDLPSTKRLRHNTAQRKAYDTPNTGSVTEKVTSTLEQVTQGAVQRAAQPVAEPVANERSAKATKAKGGKVGSTVRRVVGSLTKTASKTGVADVQAGDVETSLPLDEAPIGVPAGR